MRSGMAFVLLQTLTVATVVLTGTARAVAEDGVPLVRLGLPIAPILLLTREDVRQELQLTQEQVTAYERAVAEIYRQASALRGRKDDQAITARKAIDDRSVAWLTQSLSIAQRDRLIQLSLQWEGPSALINRPLVTESLSLTKEQGKQIDRLVQERNRLRQNGPPNLADERQLFLATRAVLDQTQRDRWLALLGKPFEPFRPSAKTAAKSKGELPASR
jgi:hypothetical protein